MKEATHIPFNKYVRLKILAGVVFWLGSSLFILSKGFEKYAKPSILIITIAVGIVAAIFVAYQLWRHRGKQYGLVFDDHAVLTDNVLSGSRTYPWTDIESISLQEAKSQVILHLKQVQKPLAKAGSAGTKRVAAKEIPISLNHIDIEALELIALLEKGLKAHGAR